MRALIISIWYPNSQNPISGTFVRDQVAALQALGVDVRVVQPLPMTPPLIRRLKPAYQALHEIAEEEVVDGVQVYHPRYVTLPSHWLFERVGGWMAGALRKCLLNIYQEWPFDVIHAHATYPCGYAANLLRDELFPQVPVVHTIHRTCIIDAPSYNDACFRKVKQSLEEADFNIFVSKEGLRLGLEYTAAAIQSHSLHIDNGVDPAKFGLNELESVEIAELKAAHASRWNLVFVGYLKEVKGIKELLAAVRQLVADGRGDLQLWLVGADHLGGYVQRYVETHGLQGNVQLVGPVAHERVKIWMAFAQAFILPSHSEGTPTVMFEALFVGVPCVFSHVGGVGDVATDEVNSLLITPRSVEAIVTPVSRLMDQPELGRRLASAGHDLIANQFTWARNAAAVQDIYRRQAGTRGGLSHA